MPIPTRQPEATKISTFHPVDLQRPGGERAGARSRSPGDHLTSGDILAPAPVPAPTRALALDALRLIRGIRDPSRRPARWAEPDFGREIEMVRRHLVPVRSRRSLVASFGREAFHIAPTTVEREDPSSIRLAYALRWMELGDGVIVPIWPRLIAL